ncbi:hypothetical protein PC129_g11644 [Phytophthora cactorum]|uniref:Glycosyltransferase 61 catalytic domain-containing protein n=1 Tax=Phytophthora cactorum TaxID=29920 RepID=A0A329RTA3_9STRA|nr:hypothetical protein Pcac1_g3287 [Phytophthora cactorum]KAG2819632.1 hypothetical protein PC111_g11804 [Phytophthora cactorum]KAG2826562.1 hypothetical protein PC112_g9238 [Phytophthora cactorum]KAG2854011.1 hypothetical protein PC113_g13696 [Phytophthora cactorum]KAG2911018.1 hypothetical protein PC115_g12713 [Phytophthora cactorum]
MRLNSRAKPTVSRSLQFMFGGFIFFAMLMLLCMWKKLPPLRSLRHSPVVIPTTPLKQASDLFTLLLKRGSTPADPETELLHLDDLVHSYSYAQWAPMIVSKCMHGMDEQAAPCIKESNRTNLVEAQELIYPAFRLKLPNFASTTMKNTWLSQGLHVDRMRVSEDQLWAEYPSFQGQNMVFANAVYRGDPPPDIWSEKGCMGHDVSHTSFEHDLNTNASDLAAGTRVGTLVVATSPDSWSFQHFVDRVAVVWSQAQLVIPTVKKTETVIVSGRKPRDAIVNNIYKVMVGQHLHKPGSVFAKRLVFSCRAPLIHPFTTQRITENIFQSLPPSATASESDRNIILFLSRSSGGKAFNGGRRILNEPKLFDAISSMLKATGRPEKLQYFRHDKFNGLDDVATFMRDRVKMMIGPHGAAFYNARFAQPHTALIEIIPDPNKFFVPCFWEQARLLGQDYSAHVGETQNAQNDMMVDDIQNVVQLVQDRLAYLDKSYRMLDALDHKYAWDVGVRR